MRYEIWESVTEWRANIFQRWWDMLNIPLTLIPVITGVILIIAWALKAEPPIPIWYLLLFGGGVVLFIVISFLAFHQMRIDRNTAQSKAMSNTRSKTDTLLEMRSSHFYDVIITLDKMREQMDNLCEINTRAIDKRILPNLVKDIAKITGTNTVVTKMIETKTFNPQQFRALNIATLRKWGDMKRPNDPKTIEFLNEISGIYKLYDADVYTLCRRNKDYRHLEKLLPAQRRLVLCDGTYKTIERYLFYLEGYGNTFMNMLIGAGCCDINIILTPEQKSQFANFKTSKNIVLTDMLKDITISIDNFIKEPVNL